MLHWSGSLIGLMLIRSTMGDRTDVCRTMAISQISVSCCPKKGSFTQPGVVLEFLQLKMEAHLGMSTG